MRRIILAFVLISSSPGYVVVMANYPMFRDSWPLLLFAFFLPPGAALVGFLLWALRRPRRKKRSNPQDIR